MGTGAERRRQRRLEEDAVRDLKSISDLTEDGGLRSLKRSRERRVISVELEDSINICALPNSIGQLKALTYLDLFHCVSLTTLPEGFGGLTALETLILGHSYALAAVPDTIGELKSLTKLDLSVCKSLVALPDSIGGLKALKVLDLAECESLTALPDTIGGLTALEELLLNKSAITALPDAIVYLKSLWKLDLERCESLTSLPHALDELKDLKELNLAGCLSLTALPPAIETTPHLNIKGWERPFSSNYVRFLQLARPRVNAEHPELANEVIDGIISDFWSVVCEARRAKLADPRDGTTYGEFLVDNLIQVIRRHKRRVYDACGRKDTIEEDRFPVCWCGARRYCGLECQKADWDAGHSRTCASGHTWSGKDLLLLRSVEQQRIQVEGKLEYYRKRLSVNVSNQDEADEADWVALKTNLELAKQALITRNPPPADRVR